MTAPTARLDTTYSDPTAVAVPWETAIARLAEAELAWIVTVRPDGRPHAVPLVPVVHDGKAYFHTGRGEVKVANIESNPNVLMLAGDTGWESGLDIGLEGVARRVMDPALLGEVDARFRERWDGRWQLDPESAAQADSGLVVFEVTPRVVRAHDKGDPFGQTRYGFPTDEKDDR